MKNFFSKFKDQWNRLNPTNQMGDDISSESDAVDFMESSEITEQDSIELSEGVTGAIETAVEKAFGTTLSETVETSIGSYFEKNPIETGMDEEAVKVIVTAATKEAVTAATKKVTEDHKELMTLANNGKLKPTESSSSTTVIPPVKKVENKEDTMTVKADELFSDSVVSLV